MSIFETMLISWEDQKIWIIFSTLWIPALCGKNSIFNEDLLLEDDVRDKISRQIFLTLSMQDPEY